MLAYLESRIAQGASSVPEKTIIEAVIPPEHPEYRLRPSYRYGLVRLLRRGVINGALDRSGQMHYFLGNGSAELRQLISSLSDEKNA